MDIKTKPRLIVLMNILYSQTDEEHPLNTVELLQKLEEAGHKINRKTLREDLNAISSMGIDLVCIKSSPNRYFIAERTFEMIELKLLIDAVLSSRFITRKKSKELTDKLMSLASTGQREQLKRHIVATGRAKADNENIYYTVDKLNDSINAKVKVAFKYYEYDGEKNKVYRNNGEKYVLSPYSLYWNEDFYYVVGYCDKHEGVSQFRVDRIDRLEKLNENAVKEPKGFNIDDYSSKVFDMFGTGEETEVTLECRNELMKYVIDRFGKEFDSIIKDEENFIAHVTVDLSPTFYAWVFQFKGGVKIVGPKKAVEEYEGMKRV